MKIFEDNAKTPKYLEKHQRLHEVLLIVCVFIIVPAISLIVATRGNERAVYKSLSYLAYRENYLPLVYFWGIVNIVAFCYALKLCVDAGGYTKTLKKIILALTIVACIILTIGISFPYLEGQGDEVYKYFVFRKIHNTMSTIGLVMFFVIDIVVLGSTFFRNKRQGAISLGMLAFILISSIGAIMLANIKPGPCPVSSIA